MSNTYGRQVVIPLTNRSGAGVIAGDVVVIDTANNDSFTTNAAGSFTSGVGIAQETIASLATGRVLTSGYAALVNVNAAVTRGNFGKTFTVVKQATDAGAARIAGTFCQFLTGGATPDALVSPADLGSGAGMTNPMTAVGDIIQGAAAGAPAALPAPLAGKVLTGAGVTTSVAYTYPPGYQYDYAQVTTDLTVTATTEATAQVIVTGASITYDGTTKIKIGVGAAGFAPQATGGADIRVIVYDNTGAAVVACVAYCSITTGVLPMYGECFVTPAAGARVYSARAYVNAGSGKVYAGSASIPSAVPAFMQITKV